MSNAQHALIALSAVEELSNWDGLGDWYLAAEVSCQVGYTFNWAGNEILCSEEVPVWGVLRIEASDFQRGPHSAWVHVLDEYNVYLPTGAYA